ncbi:MAG TPA: AarF/ABC1/UbiB kinase family protein [Alphaproteobacteria bacterium]|nr:AarF/ABC1/UbiB kinase family protein [Alphaproteobacteria bacterium]
MADQHSREKVEREGSTLGGRVKRYARVGRAVGGLAVELAGKRYFGRELDRARHAHELAAALGGLKGPLMKVAQLLSTIPDALPREYVAELSTLQANAPPMGWPFVKRRMAAELGPDWQTKFRSFEQTAARAASLGQVHRATSLGGEALACKLQYPEMSSTVEADLRQLKLVFAIYERTDKAISTKNIHAEIAERLREELDYDREARHMRLYGAMLAEEAGVEVPKVMPKLSTRRLLTMTWLEGTPLMESRSWPLEKRNRIAHNMFRAWYVPFYFYGIIHGDPHLGNYTVRPDGTVNLLDFGCIRVFHSRFVQGVIDLYFALRDDNEALAVHAYETWGFKNLNREMVDTLNMWAHFVYAPLMEDRKRQIEETNSGVYGARVAEKVHRELRRLGGVTPPREFVLMDRAAIGLGSVFLHLAAEINWHRLFHELIRGFDERALAKRQRAALEREKLPLPS